MGELISNFYELLLALGAFLRAAAAVLLPATPILAWLAFWYFAVNWTRLRATLGNGAWLLVGLISVLAGVVRLTTAAEVARLPLLDVAVSPFVSVVVEVTVLMSTALLAGAAQVSRAVSHHS